MGQVDCVRPGASWRAVFFIPSPPHPLSPNGAGVAASKWPVEAAAPAAGMDAPSKSICGGYAPTPAWKTLRVFHSRLDAVPASTSSHRPLSQGYILDGSTILPKVTFLNGLTGMNRRLPGSSAQRPCRSAAWFRA